MVWFMVRDVTSFMALVSASVLTADATLSSLAPLSSSVSSSMEGTLVEGVLCLGRSLVYGVCHLLWSSIWMALTTSMCPFSRARSRADLPLSALTWRSAPASTSSLLIPSKPFPAALCSGVQPHASRGSGLAPPRSSLSYKR